jgi:soluble lytic murein transglycosylase
MRVWQAPPRVATLPRMRSITTTLARIARCAAVLLLGTAATHGAQPDPMAVARGEFQKAYGRLDDPSAPSTDSAVLRGYVLYPYLQAARLAQALRDARTAVPPGLDEQVAAFVATHEGTPVVRDLRRAWLAGLAERRQWERFLSFHRPETDESALRCHGFTARIELQRTDGLAADIARTWLTPRSLPECERAFDWLRSAGALDDALIEQRVRLALEDGNARFARQIVTRLPASRAAPLLQWIALLENPRKGFDALIQAGRTDVDAQGLLAAWSRFAR